MCLLIEILMPGVPRTEAGSLSREAARQGLLEMSAQRQSRDAAGSRFLLSEPRQGCACSLLGENADWGLAYYELNPARTAALEATLRFLGSKAGPAGFAIRAAWLDGVFEEAATATVRRARLVDLLAEVRAARIGNNVRYEIAETAA
jgi:hypothetical protein